MPIPNDPLQRWWVEVAAENPNRVAELRPALLAFLAFGPGREPSFAGSGFIIAGRSELALAITAKHVLTEGVGRVQRPWSQGASSAVFKNLSTPALTIDPRKLKVSWKGTHYADMMNVDHAAYNDSLDIACNIITPQSGASVKFQPITIQLDTTVPTVGQLVHMVSLSGLAVTEDKPPVDASGNGQAITITRNISIRVGVVTGVYPTGLRHYRWPCFTTSIPAEPGMSGGFVTLPREGKAIAACGIVCADNSPDEARSNFLNCGESIIACAWPALALRAPNYIPSTSTGPSHTLYSLMCAGRMIEPVGGLDRIEIIEQENGDCSIRIREQAKG